jgi:outer membrane protein assembly factor BamA
MTRRLPMVLLLALLLAGPAAAAATTPGFAVVDVHFVGLDDPGFEQQLRQMVNLQPGDHVSVEELDFAVKLIALRPEIDGVSVRTRDVSEGRRDVEFTLHRTRLVERVEWRRVGRQRAGIDRTTAIVEQLRLPLRESADTVTEVAGTLTAALREEGHREALVEATVQPEGRWSAVLVLRMRPGPLWRVLDVEWANVPDGAPRPPELRLEPWSEPQLRQRIDTWLLDLRAAGWYDATAGLTCQSRAGAWADCRVDVAAGPRATFRFEGNRTFFDPDLREALAIEGTRRYTTAELARRAVALEQFHIAAGLAFAKVTAAVHGAGEDAALVVFFIDEGEPRSFRRIDLVGVPEDMHGEIFSGMAITPLPRQELLYGKSRDLLPDARQADLARLTYTLQRNGYLEAQVVEDSIEPEGDDLAIWRIVVETGTQQRWRSLELPDGAEYDVSFDVPDGLAEGRPADPFALRDLADRMVMQLRDVGYLDAQAEPSYHPDRTRGGVIGRIRLESGPRYQVTAVIVRGNRRARTSAILNSLPLRRGDTADYGALFEGRRRLLERRVFQQVQTQWVLRDAALGRAVALYDVIERNGGEIEAGLLLTTGEGIGFDTRLTHNRLFGSFRNLRFEGSATFRPEDVASGNWVRQPFRSRLSLRYREPFPNRIPLTGQLQALNELSRQDPDYDWRAQNVAAGMAWEPSLDGELNADYVFEWFTRFNVLYPNYDPPGTDLIGSLRVSGFLSRFDDRFDPKRGWGTFHEAQLAQPWLGGDFGFVRYEGSLRGLVPIVGRFSLWLGGRVGSLLGTSDVTDVPRFKRFRLGGPSSVRGYLRDSVSPWVPLPSGESLAIGGREFAALQSEVRVGLWRDFELAIFSDSAVVTGWTGDPAVASGWGGGVLYHTPAGPLRLDYGRKFVEIPTDRSVYAIHFYIFASL